MTKRSTYKGLQPGDQHPQLNNSQQKLIPWVSFTTPTSQGAPPPPSKTPPTNTGEQVPFTITGTLAVATGKVRWPAPFPLTLKLVDITANTAPTGASIICDVRKNGTTIFTGGVGRPTIAASAFAGVSGAPAITAMVTGDYLQFDVSQVGSTIAGSDLVGVVYYTVP